MATRHFFRRFIALLALAIAAAWSVSAAPVGVEFSALPVDASVEEDAELAAYLRPFREGVEAFATEVIGYAAEPLSRTGPECGLSNFAADALLAVGAKEFEAKPDFAITNYGGLRRDLPAGPLTMGLLTELSPFQNYIVYLEIDGELVWSIAEAAARGGVAVAGLTVERTEDGELVTAWIGGRLIDRDRSYKLVTIDYLVSTWKDLFREDLIQAKRVSENLVQRDALALHLSDLAKRGVRLRDAGEGRVRTVEERR